jgi:hypothetical protein
VSIVSRTNLIRNPSFELDLSLWSAFGSASISRVTTGISYQMRITFPTAAAGASGASISVSGLSIGASYVTWFHVPTATGSTTVQIEAQGISSGAAFATNGTLFKQGALTFTATATSHTIRIKSAVGSTSGDTVDVEGGICEVTQGLVDYPVFDGSMPGAYWDGPVQASPSVFPYYDTSVGEKPYIVVEFDARPVLTSDFVLDRNSLDDANVALIESPRWLTIPEAERVQIQRGRQSEDTDIGVGNATIVLRDYEGIYDPDNPATPLQIGGVPVMRAGMRIRVSMLVDVLGALLAEQLFTGSLEDVKIDRTYEPTVTISAVDDMSKLNTAAIPPCDPPIGYASPTIGRAVWALSFTGLGFFDATYGANMNRLMLATSGGGDVGSHLRQVANCEGGKVFVQRNGLVHIGSHADDFATSPAAVFSDSSTGTDLEYDSIVTSTSIRTLINQCIVQRGDYSAPAAGEAAPLDAAPAVPRQDDDSIALNDRVWSETFDAPLLSDSDAANLATWRATRRSRSATRVTSLALSLTGQDILAVLNHARLDLASVIRIKRYAFGRGIDDLYGVGGIEHDISVIEGWKSTLYTEPLDVTGLYADQPHPFILDSSALDSADILSSF